MTVSADLPAEEPGPPVDHAAAAQRAAEEHVRACYAYLHDEGPEPDGLAAPFCGCPACDVRETLHAAYPHLRALWEAERAAQAGTDDTGR